MALWVLAVVLLKCSIGSSSSYVGHVNSFGMSNQESDWTPIANHIFSRPQQASPEPEKLKVPTIITDVPWQQQSPYTIATHRSKSAVLSAPTAPIPSQTTSPMINELENHEYRHRPSLPKPLPMNLQPQKQHPQPLKQHPQPMKQYPQPGPMVKRRPAPTRKIIPSLFLQKMARKVFFPDRRVDRDRHNPIGPSSKSSKLRFENSNNKIMFPPRNDNKAHNISNRLRHHQMPIVCAFRTESIGLNGERCIQV